jgi:hypothetical protein
MIQTITHQVGNWVITMSDEGALNKENPNKIDFSSISRACLFEGCNEVIRIDRTSGLCDNHKFHQHDLLLSLKDSRGNEHSVPAHIDIIDCLIAWAKTRNFNLDKFFEDISFSILGNIPDVTSLANEVNYGVIPIPTLNTVFTTSIEVAEKHFPASNNSSYQPLTIRTGDIPVIVLAHVFIGLIVCEEANRGDRWHCRVVRGDEKQTSKLGGAMPIAYYASKTFRWGIEMGKSARLLIR